jgi:hypothetical protein
MSGGYYQSALMCKRVLSANPPDCSVPSMKHPGLHDSLKVGLMGSTNITVCKQSVAKRV